MNPAGSTMHHLVRGNLRVGRGRGNWCCSIQAPTGKSANPRRRYCRKQVSGSNSSPAAVSLGEVAAEAVMGRSTCGLHRVLCEDPGGTEQAGKCHISKVHQTLGMGTPGSVQAPVDTGEKGMKDLPAPGSQKTTTDRQGDSAVNPAARDAAVQWGLVLTATHAGARTTKPQ